MGSKNRNLGDETVYITLVRPQSWLRVGDMVTLEKEPDNLYDDEAIMAFATGGEDGFVEDFVGEAMYVANSVSSVARGTHSAGRIYDRLLGAGRARVEFIVRGLAIAKVVDWGESEQDGAEELDPASVPF